MFHYLFPLFYYFRMLFNPFIHQIDRVFFRTSRDSSGISLCTKML
jgi:hypothetical protein